MSVQLLTRCGYRCDLCFAYKDNIEKDDQRTFLSDTWYKIFGFRIPPNDIYCEGCITNCGGCVTKNDPVARLLDADCPVRPCVIKKGIENCSQCDDYPCGKFNQRAVVYENLLRDNKNISGKEYLRCIKPYENKKRLDELREQNQKNSRMLNPEIVPDREGMLKFIEKDEVQKGWSELINFADTNYNMDDRIMFYGKSYGWAVQYKKSQKTIITFFPERKSFTVLVTLGKNELEKINKNRDIFSNELLKAISDTPQFHDGKWVWVRLENAKHIKDIPNLLKAKTGR